MVQGAELEIDGGTRRRVLALEPEAPLPWRSPKAPAFRVPGVIHPVPRSRYVIQLQYLSGLT